MDKKLFIKERPLHPEEEYIFSTINGRTEVQNFSKELHEILTNERVYLWCTGEHDRQKARVKYGDGSNDYALYNLSRIVLMFNLYFEEYRQKYRHMSEAISRFIEDIPKLSVRLEECAHIDAHTWNNTSTNIMNMSKQTNYAMKDLIKNFVGEYDAYTTGVPQEENSILVGIKHTDSDIFFHCDTAADYYDLQMQFLAKTPMLKNTSVHRNGGEIFTPEQAYVRYGRGLDNKFEEWLVWKYCDRRDNLLLLYNEAPEMFFPWSETNETVYGVAKSILISYILSGCSMPKKIPHLTIIKKADEET